MKKIQKYLLPVCLMLIVAISLTACGKGDNKQKTLENKEKVDEAKKEEVKQVLNMPLAQEPQSLDGCKAADGYAGFVLAEALENLVRMEVNEKGESVLVPAAAEKWELSGDSLEWTFTIRDAKWSDGEPVTANDFEYGVKRILNPETASSIAGNLIGIKNVEKIINGEADYTEAGIEAIDEKTLKIYLEYPIPYFLEMVTDREFYPHREDIVEKYGEEYGTDVDKLVYNGPFKPVNWVHNSKIECIQNEEYWDKDSVSLEELNFHIIEDKNALMAELESGKIDFSEVSGEWVEKLESNEHLEKVSLQEPTTSYVYYNHKDELMKNDKIRKALSAAIDREEMNEAIFDGVHTPGYAWVAPPTQIDGKQFRDVVEEPVKELIKEVEDPKALFKEGLKELGIDKEPEDINISIMLPASIKLTGEYLQQVYKEKIGINLEVDPCDWPVFMERTGNLDYQMGSMAWGASVDDPYHFFKVWVSDSYVVNIGWENKEYDDLVKEASRSVDSEKRLENYKRAEEILVKDDCAVIPYNYLNRYIYKTKNVKNLMIPGYGSSTVVKYVTIED